MIKKTHDKLHTIYMKEKIIIKLEHITNIINNIDVDNDNLIEINKKLNNIINKLNKNIKY